jgi:hypothetical protein
MMAGGSGAAGGGVAGAHLFQQLLSRTFYLHSPFPPVLHQLWSKAHRKEAKWKLRSTRNRSSPRESDTGKG